MTKKNRYIISRRINRGGMAEIFLGKFVGEGGFARLCAIKRILPHYAAEKEFVQMFRDEANICKRLNHANIVQVHSFEELDNSYALIMEYVDGADLRSTLSACEKVRKRPSVPMVLYIGTSIARGLHYAHTKVDDLTGQALEIVHRDVSPQNIMISYEGEVKITDFGIADAENKISETKPGIVKGKYSYMSPEQVSAEALDARSDVFSLAIVLWEALAMRRLFAGDTEVQTIKLVQECKPPVPLADLNPGVDAELEAIILKGLARDRQSRYSSAAAFEEALSTYLHSRFPDFTGTKLGAFLKELFASKRETIQREIRRTLTHPDNPAAEGTSVPSSGKSELPAADHVAAPPPPEGRPQEPQTTLNASQRPGALPAPVHGAAIPPVAFHPSALRSKQGTQFHRRPQARSSSMMTGWIALGLIALLTAVFGIKLRSRAGDPSQLQITTTPASVLVEIDGVDISKGQYIQTPSNFELAPGSHRLKLSRAGYQSTAFDFDLSPGQSLVHDKIILKRDPKHNAVPVRILVHQDRPLQVSVDGGLYVVSTPIVLPDLTANVAHTVVAFPNGLQNPKTAFKCGFVPTSGLPGEPFILTIYPGEGGPRCTIRAPR